MNRYRVAADWYDKEDIESSTPITAVDARHAAEKYVEDNFANLDYPQSVDVWVMNETGKMESWLVQVEAVPSFYATRNK